MTEVSRLVVCLSFFLYIKCFFVGGSEEVSPTEMRSRSRIKNATHPRVFSGYGVLRFRSPLLHSSLYLLRSKSDPMADTSKAEGSNYSLYSYRAVSFICICSVSTDEFLS